MEEKILEFIHRRFPVDCNWTSGNCYFFAIILQTVFGGELYYDLIYGHFVAKIKDNYYDYTGKYNKTDGYLKSWEDLPDFDRLQADRIYNDCCI